LNYFPHEAITNIKFSNDENYAVSFNGTSLYAPNMENFIVWDIASG
jgi:hypothetical protein